MLMASEYHRNLLERSVSGTLSNTVDSNLHLSCSVKDSLQGIGRRHAEVIMAMGGDDGLVNAVDMLHEILYLCSILVGHAIAGSVGYVHDSCSGLDDSLYNACEVFIVCAASVLGVELHILNVALGIGNSPNGTLYNLLAVGVELIFDMAVARSDTRVYTLVLGILQRLRSNVNILLYSSCQRTYCWPCNSLGDFYHRIEVTW